MNPVDVTDRTSVVIPTRSRPELLGIAIRSILAQDHPGEIEVVVVFDQCEPESSIATSWVTKGHAGPRRVRVVTNARTPGLAGARNTGVSAATGDVLAFCDDDDSWRPAKLRTQLEAMTHTGSGLSACGIEIVFGDRTHTRVPQAGEVTPETLARRRVMEAHPSTIVVRRDAFGRIGWVDEDIPGSYAEDYDWMLRAVALEPVAVVSQPLVRVLWHPGSFFSTRWQTVIEALDYCVAKHASIRSNPRGLARIYGQKAFAYAALGARSDARHWAWQSLRLSARERRSYLALAVSTGLLPASAVVRAANSRGRGI
jgi:glycosyltransferase involved in cell wall biosynthesis